MNHAVSCAPTFINRDSSHTFQLYDAIVAAVTDINFTVPSQRRLTLDIIASNQEWSHEIHVIQNEQSLCIYELDVCPSLFRRMWTTITLGFVDHVKVESIKEEIISHYTYGERAID
jgi:hypothetical protein